MCVCCSAEGSLNTGKEPVTDEKATYHAGFIKTELQIVVEIRVVRAE